MTETHFDKLTPLLPIVEVRTPPPSTASSDIPAPSFGDHLKRAGGSTSPERRDNADSQGSEGDARSTADRSHERAPHESPPPADASRDSDRPPADDVESAQASNADNSQDDESSDNVATEDPANSDTTTEDEVDTESTAVVIDDVVDVESQHVVQGTASLDTEVDAENQDTDRQSASRQQPRAATATAQDAGDANSENATQLDKRADLASATGQSADAPDADGGDVRLNSEISIDQDHRNQTEAESTSRIDASRAENGHNEPPQSQDGARPTELEQANQPSTASPATASAETSVLPGKRTRQKQTGAADDRNAASSDVRPVRTEAGNPASANLTLPENVEHRQADRLTSTIETSGETTDTTSKPTSESAPTGELRSSRRAPLSLGRSTAASSDGPDGPTAAQRARFVQRVARAFNAIGDRGGPLRLRLSPPELGSLRLEVQVRSGVVTARIEAETPMARTMLLDSLPALRDRLAGQDIKIERFDVDLMDQSPDGMPQTPQEDRRTADQQRRAAANVRRPTQTDNQHEPIRAGDRSISGDGELNVVV